MKYSITSQVQVYAPYVRRRSIKQRAMAVSVPDPINEKGPMIICN